MFPKRETTPRRSLHTPREQPLFAPTRENPQATAKIQDTQYTNKQACLVSLKSKSKVLMEKPEQTPQCPVPAPGRQPPPRCWFTGNPAAGSCVSPAGPGPLPGSLRNGRPGLRCSRGHQAAQARLPLAEWVAISFSRGSSRTQGSNLGLLHCRQTLRHTLNAQQPHF